MKVLQNLIETAAAIASRSPKKRIESLYMDEARRVSSIFPIGELVPYEKPDFLLRVQGGMLGIEVTELCRQEQRAEGGKLAKVAERAQVRYNQLANIHPVDVSASFAPNIESVGLKRLTDGLADFVY